MSQTNKSTKKSRSVRARRMKELTSRPVEGLEGASGAEAALASHDPKGGLKEHIKHGWANLRDLTWTARTKGSPQPLARAASSHPRAATRFWGINIMDRFKKSREG